jgi:hypothetical protein
MQCSARRRNYNWLLFFDDDVYTITDIHFKAMVKVITVTP